jgi:hypothetical protein
MNKIYFVLLSLIFLSQNLFAGAWTKKKGSGYYKLGFRFITAEMIYNEGGEKIPLNGTFNDYTIGFYGEYGLTDNFTVTTSFLGFRAVDFQSNPGPFQRDDSESGLGDVIIGMRGLISRLGKTVISAGVNFNIPLGKSTPDDALLLSGGDFSQAVNLQVGHSLYPLPSYFNIFLMFNNRTEGFSDEFRYGIEGGYSFYNDLSLIIRAKAQQPLYNGSDSKIGGFGILLNDQKYIAYGAELIYKLTKHFGFTVFYESGTAGKNIVSAPVYNFGIYYAN